jgi:hypothetical protein
MIKRIGPKFHSKVSPSEESSDRIRQSSMGALDWSILEGRFSSSGSDFIPFGCEEVSDMRIVIKLAALIKMDILVFTRVTRGVLREEETKPFDGGSFGSSGITILHTGEVVSD